MEQIANLSTGNRRQGSNPCLSAYQTPFLLFNNRLGVFFFVRLKIYTPKAPLTQSQGHGI